MDETDGQCPAASEVDPEALASPTVCGGEIVAVTGGPCNDPCWFGPGRGAAEEAEGGCWYDVRIRGGGDCTYGRPWGDPAAVTRRADWSRPSRPRPLDAERARWWAGVGLAEHASIASFARFTLELLAMGAPSDLVLDAQRAAADEVRHAVIAFGLASAFAGHSVGPGALPSSPARSLDLVSVAVACAREGCLVEALSALDLDHRARSEPDAEIRRALRAIAQDEARHAPLAWRTVQWAVRTGGDPVRVAVREVLDGAEACDVIGPVAAAVLAA